MEMSSMGTTSDIFSQMPPLQSLLPTCYQNLATEAKYNKLFKLIISFSVDKTFSCMIQYGCYIIVTKTVGFFYQCYLCNKSAWKRKSMFEGKYPFGDKYAFEPVLMLLKI